MATGWLFNNSYCWDLDRHKNPTTIYPAV